MLKIKMVAILAAVLGGGWYYYTNYDIAGLPGRLFKPRETQPDQTPDKQLATATTRKGDSIRIASFNLGMLDRIKLDRKYVTRCLAETIRRYDVLAVQDIRAHDKGILLSLLEQVNSQSRQYDFATAPGIGRDEVDQYSVFLFDRGSVDIDRRTVFTVSDPAGRFRRPPLAASFRVRGPDVAQAFTFTLINVHVERNQATAELELLDDVFRAVRDDGRGEDDIILLGDFEVDDRHLARLEKGLGLRCLISGVPSTTRGGRLVDNILIDRRATVESTGRSGVLDLMREYDLKMQEALEVSDHLPVWAEFSIYEGGQAGHVAVPPRDSTRATQEPSR